MPSISRGEISRLSLSSLSTTDLSVPLLAVTGSTIVAFLVWDAKEDSLIDLTSVEAPWSPSPPSLSRMLQHLTTLLPPHPLLYRLPLASLPGTIFSAPSTRSSITSPRVSGTTGLKQSRLLSPISLLILLIQSVGSYSLCSRGAPSSILGSLLPPLGGMQLRLSGPGSNGGGKVTMTISGLSLSQLHRFF